MKQSKTKRFKMEFRKEIKTKKIPSNIYLTSTFIKNLSALAFGSNGA